MDFKELAKQYDTPYYVYDFNYIEEQYHGLKDAFKGKKTLVSYAIKANSNLSVIQHLSNLGSGADCVSIGEVKRAIRVGIRPYKIVFSGVGKRDEEIKEALNLDILMINVESSAEMKRVEIIAKELDIKARISIRVNPNIDPKTHPYISTGLHDNKFGVDINSAKRMYIDANNSDYLDPLGIHFHIGSQLTQLQPIKESSQIIADLVRSLKAINIELKFFDVGGGLGIKYDNETTIKPVDYAEAINSTLKGLDITIIMEPGRFLVANSGYFVTKVLYEKTNESKRFVIVDGAMNDLLRPSLYNAYHDIELLNNNIDKSKCDIVGPVCESGDFFAKDIELAQTEHNDLIVIKSAGAYGFTMSSNYNTRARVCEIAYQDNQYRVIRQREKFEDLIYDEEKYLI